MTRRRALILASLLAFTVSWHPAQAQTAVSLLEQGINAYQDLELEAAIGFLQGALDPALAQQMADPAAARVFRVRALTYLAAAEALRGNTDSALAVFGRLVRLDTRYRPDQLIFPPEVTNIYDAVRREIKVVTVDAPQVTRLRLGQGLFSLKLFASSYHDVTADIRDRDSIRVRSLYRGPIVDSLELEWDGRDPERLVVPSGAYDLWVKSQDSTGNTVRTLRLPLDIQVESPDTLFLPVEPADSLILPEQFSNGPGVQALAGGLLIGAAVAVLPSMISSTDSDLMGGRFVVAGTISIAGVATFFRLRPGKPIPANIESNLSLYRTWQDSLAIVLTENEQRKSDVQLVIRVAQPSAYEVPGR
jgi:hypothetical protein